MSNITLSNVTQSLISSMDTSDTVLMWYNCPQIFFYVAMEMSKQRIVYGKLHYSNFMGDSILPFIQASVRPSLPLPGCWRTVQVTQIIQYQCA